jgi:Fur family ferric uptake transcriptional regulator
MSCEELFLKKLRERGFRLTPQREMVLRVMHQMAGFATAEEIFQRVQELSSAIDISTVYRTLELLQEFQMVSMVDPGDGQRRYELVGVHGPHIHLVCQDCGEVTPIDLDEFQEFVDHVRRRHGFTIDISQVSLPGYCNACASRHQEPEHEEQHEEA